MLATRIITALILGVIVTAGVLFLPTAAAAVILGALWLAGSWEWAGFANWKPPARSAYSIGFAVLMLIAFLWALRPAVLNAVLALAVAGWIVALYGVLTYPRPIAGSLISLAGFVALLPGWLLLTHIHGAGPLGPGLALAALALVWAADVGAFVIGSLVGRVKLAPEVSPGKTWEGVAGGIGLSVGVAWLASYALSLPPRLLIGLALMTAVVSVVGDLTVSMLKRNVGVKDSGSLLPGHGGVMDRIDGLTAAVPFFALGLKLTGLID